jgi:hypothetical protein
MASRAKKSGTHISQSDRAGVGVTVSSVSHAIRDEIGDTRLGKRAPVAAAAAIDFIVKQLLKDINKEIASEGKNRRITSDRIEASIRANPDLRALLMKDSSHHAKRGKK